MEKQELKTDTVKGGGKMIEAEPVNYCGMKDFCMVTYLQDGLLFLIKHFIDTTAAEGVQWSDEVCARISSVCYALGDVSYYRAAYLTRRIESLENALGLKHCGDIEPTADYFEWI